ncbi:hypothetical protein [Streptomyces lavendulae]|uniref:hypothetical protein n=1 Tax=Streptomyces lavendulae TaxID=1914 RepID=UPI0024A583E3|nr:hypothetical protein [Streptomyces lavendulae]GLX22597.1 hypothetical protein Slala01_62410 [Streptomyces lavendulae subsp. lavendulae]GLX30080.1 hypothetical protein Slala02_59000 [Streptomyces lavendulae subsp. lavendulae]
MKRNKPYIRRRKAGTQDERRRAYRWRESATSHWALAVPQAFVGTGQTVLDMTGAAPAGSDESAPDSPRYGLGSLLRWRLDRDGQTQFVYGIQVWGRYRSESSSAYGKRISDAFRRSLPTSPDVHHVFVAERPGCARGTRCPLTDHWYTAIEADLSTHRPDRCPMGVLNDGPPWRLVGRTVPDGRLIY